VTFLPVDAHAHIDVEIAPQELSALNALVFAVTRSLDEAEPCLRRSDAMTVWGVGCHPALPEAVDAFDRGRFAAILPRAAFVGEVGLDRRSRVPMERQREVLGQILDQVREIPRAVSLHSTGASSAVLDILEQHPIRFPILHWWRGNPSETKRALELGVLFSLNGHEAKSPKVLPLIPIDRVITETDFPHSQRYDRAADRPSAVSTIESGLAQHYRLSVDEVRQRIWKTLTPLVDAMPEGVVSTELREHLNASRNACINLPHVRDEQGSIDGGDSGDGGA
jgi:TatD DNase family protein